jgi:putative phosphoribosyl transferase
VAFFLSLIIEEHFHQLLKKFQEKYNLDHAPPYLSFHQEASMLSHNFKFIDRSDAGRKLGERLLVRAFKEPMILALPRGGVPVAEEVARILGGSLDIVVARKIGAPGHEEFGIGALSEDEVPQFNQSIMSYFNVTGTEVSTIVRAETEELRRRIAHYRKGRELPDMRGRTVILIDDGLATGATAAAAGEFLRSLQPKQIIFAAPVCPEDVGAEVREIFDEIICLQRPRNFQAVGLWYEDFRQVDDEEVISILDHHHVSANLLPNQGKENINRMI